MSGWTKRLIALALLVPFGLYAANAISAALDRSAAPLPASQAPDRAKSEALRADAKAKADRARNEIQAAVSYRSDDAARHKDILAERNWLVRNAQSFDQSNAKFGGKFKDVFQDAYKSQEAVRVAQQAIDDWLSPSHKIPPDAMADLKECRDTLIGDYRRAGGPPVRAAELELRCLRKTEIECYARFLAEFDTAVKEAAIPFSGSARLVADGKDLVQVQKDFQTVYTATPELQDKMRLESDTVAGDEKESRALLELLELFAVDPAGATPKAGGDWLDRVNALYANLKSARTKKLLQQKTQQFCDAFLPPKLALDDELTFQGKPAKRSDVKVRYVHDSDREKFELQPLTADPEGRNERTAPDRAKSPPPASHSFHRFILGGNSANAAEVAPTARSVAAFDYHAVRQDIAADGWTAKSVAKLLAKAGPPDAEAAALWNGLARIGKSGEYKAYNRLTVLAASIEKCRNLFVNP